MKQPTLRRGDAALRVTEQTVYCTMASLEQEMPQLVELSYLFCVAYLSVEHLLASQVIVWALIGNTYKDLTSNPTSSGTE